MSIGLIISSNDFTAKNLTLFGHLKEELRVLRTLDLVILDRSEFSDKLLRPYLENQGVCVMQWTHDETINTFQGKQKIKAFDIFVLNILGFNDAKMEELESIISSNLDNRNQTYRLFRWMQHQPSKTLELIDFNSVALNARYRRLKVRLLDGDGEVTIINSPVFTEGEWKIEAETSGGHKIELPLSAFDLTPFLEILF